MSFGFVSKQRKTSNAVGYFDQTMMQGSFG